MHYFFPDTLTLNNNPVFERDSFFKAIVKKKMIWKADERTRAKGVLIYQENAAAHESCGYNYMVAKSGEAGCSTSLKTQSPDEWISIKRSKSKK